MSESVFYIAMTIAAIAMAAHVWNRLKAGRLAPLWFVSSIPPALLITWAVLVVVIHDVGLRMGVQLSPGEWIPKFLMSYILVPFAFLGTAAFAGGIVGWLMVKPENRVVKPVVFISTLAWKVSVFVVIGLAHLIGHMLIHLPEAIAESNSKQSGSSSFSYGKSFVADEEDEVMHKRYVEWLEH